MFSMSVPGLAASSFFFVFSYLPFPNEAKTKKNKWNFKVTEMEKNVLLWRKYIYYIRAKDSVHVHT